jgi:hypothetical protein
LAHGPGSLAASLPSTVSSSEVTMAADEQARLGMYEAMKQVIGVDHATTFMEHLPHGGWQQLATKDDIAGLRAATKDDVARLRAATNEDIARLRAATKDDVALLKDDIARLEGATRNEIDKLELRLDAKVQKQLNDLQRNLFFGFLAAQAAFAGLVIGLT